MTTANSPICKTTAKVEQTKRGLTLKLWGCRTMYANVNRPRKAADGKPPKYDCEFLLPKTAEGADEVVKAIRELGAKTFSGAAWKCAAVRDGDKEIQEKRDMGSEIDDTMKLRAGCWIIRANAGIEYPPQVLGNIYSGCYAGAVIGLSKYEAPDKSSRGIKGYLNGVQFHGDGEAFGGGATDVAAMLGMATPESNNLPSLPENDFTAGLPGFGSAKPSADDSDLPF